MKGKENYSTSPDTSEVYLKFFEKAEEIYGPEDMRKIYHLLTDQKPTLDNNLITQLRSMSDEVESNAPINIIRARKILQTFFATSLLGYSLKREDARIIIYGSLQYADPRNLDADLLIVFGKNPTSHSEQNMHLLRNSLIRLWRKRKIGAIPKAEPHLSIFSLEYFQDIKQSLDKNPELFDYRATDLSIAISGTTLFAEDKKWLTEFGNKARSIAQSNPLLTALVNYHLQECFETRLARKSNHPLSTGINSLI